MIFRDWECFLFGGILGDWDFGWVLGNLGGVGAFVPDGVAWVVAMGDRVGRWLRGGAVDPS